MPNKYGTIAIYYPKDDVNIAGWAVGDYINELLDKGLTHITIINKHMPHEGHNHDKVDVPEEEPYTDIQGNVGSS